MYFGKMTSPDRFTLNEKKKEFTIIEDILGHDFCCGPSMISIIDNRGNIFL